MRQEKMKMALETEEIMNIRLKFRLLFFARSIFVSLIACQRSC